MHKHPRAEHVYRTYSARHPDRLTLCVYRKSGDATGRFDASRDGDTATSGHPKAFYSVMAIPLSSAKAGCGPDVPRSYVDVVDHAPPNTVIGSKTAVLRTWHLRCVTWRLARLCNLNSRDNFGQALELLLRLAANETNET